MKASKQVARDPCAQEREAKRQRRARRRHGSGLAEGMDPGDGADRQRQRPNRSSLATPARRKRDHDDAMVPTTTTVSWCELRSDGAHDIRRETRSEHDWKISGHGCPWNGFRQVGVASPREEFELVRRRRRRLTRQRRPARIRRAPQAEG